MLTEASCKKIDQNIWLQPTTAFQASNAQSRWGLNILTEAAVNSSHKLLISISDYQLPKPRSLKALESVGFSENLKISLSTSEI